jgi:D-tyrosyl-tRNA(Tyr) deacylase
VVASAVRDRWGTLPADEGQVDGVPIRRLGPHRLVLRRPGPHIHDERLDGRLPEELRARRPTLVFPSIHRSESGQRCFTVHPLGNPGSRAELGGEPRTLVPSDPPLMAALLLALQEAGERLGTLATYEATHHGPALELPALFAEIAVREGERPPHEEVVALAQALATAEPDGEDRAVLGVGGGHYAPRFRDLCRSRRWAFGHLLSRHALADLEASTARAAWAATPGAAGILFARAQDRAHPAFQGLGPVLRETDAPVRPRAGAGPTGSTLPASGT